MKSSPNMASSPSSLVVVNLYPFEATVARPGVTHEEAIEQIDIGGPTMVRAAAKNHAFTTIATSAAAILGDSRSDRGPRLHHLRVAPQLAGEAFAHTARYDRAIADLLCRARRGRAVSRHSHDRPGPARWCSATARIRTSRRPCMPSPTPSAPAWSPPGNSTARSFRTTTCWTWTARWRSCGSSPSRPRW